LSEAFNGSVFLHTGKKLVYNLVNGTREC